MEDPTIPAYKIAFRGLNDTGQRSGPSPPSILKAIEPSRFRPEYRDQTVALTGGGGEAKWCGIVRHGLHNAIVAGSLARYTKDEEGNYSGFGEVAKAAHRAASTLEIVTRKLTKSPDVSARSMALSIHQTRIGSATTLPTPEFPVGLAAGEEAAAVLLTAITILKEVAVGADKRRSEFSRRRQKPGEPEKYAFLEQLAGVWHTLVGRKPSKSTDPLKNPFLRFVLAGWLDWKGERATRNEPSFGAALRRLHTRKL